MKCMATRNNHHWLIRLGSDPKVLKTYKDNKYNKTQTKVTSKTK